MINLKGLKGFCAVTGDTSREVLVVRQRCLVSDIPFIRIQENQLVPEGYVPVGSVEWVQSVLKFKPIPDYSPYFLTEYLHRKITTADTIETQSPIFVKPSDSYKRFEGFVYLGNQELPDGPYVLSEVVNFINEWRYYVSNGNILAAEWYKGIEECKAPEIQASWPATYCGAVDFGELDSGVIALVEAHHPFACGWYGDDHEAYIQWLIDGWIDLTKQT